MCDYCKDRLKGKKIKEFDGGNGVAEIWDNHLYVQESGTGNNVLGFKINYCPMCGRKLEV